MPDVLGRRTTNGGSLTVVGTGIDVTTQLTPAAQAAIAGADQAFYLVADSVAALRIAALNPRARSLEDHYAPGKDRRETYSEIVEVIVGATLEGVQVCAVFYGHPGFFARPGHDAVRRVQAAGLNARMLPAVSTLDCLYADLGVDPGDSGLQCYEATDFVQRRPAVDPDAMLVLLQVGMIGESGGAQTEAAQERFRSLVEMLRELYGESREAFLYEASPYPGPPAAVVRFGLGDSEPPRPTTLSTLCLASARRVSSR